MYHCEAKYRQPVFKWIKPSGEGGGETGSLDPEADPRIPQNQRKKTWESRTRWKTFSMP